MAGPQRDAAGTVERWQAGGPGSNSKTAAIGNRMLAGEWIGAPEIADMDCSPAMLHQTRSILMDAGYQIDRQPMPGSNGFRYRVTGSPGQAPPVAAESEGAAVPPLGARLTVRALSLDERGRLVVHLSNGQGGAWTAQITGHVG
jgi:hypothetical protein